MYVCTYVADDHMEVSFINFFLFFGGWVGGGDSWYVSVCAIQVSR